MAYTVQRFGWIRDLPDQRDHLYSAPLQALTALPPAVNLQQEFSEPYDQGQLGSCTANGIAAAIEFDRSEQQCADQFRPSRLFIYYNERKIEHTIESDSGAMIRDGIKSVAKQGVCPEEHWPYDIDKFRTKPSKPCYEEALQYRALQYQRLAQNLRQMKGCIASGYPFVFGFVVYDSFMTDEVAKTGIVPMPQSSETVQGGHCVVAVGYDDDKQCFIARNSWGTGWGQDGYFLMPYAYLIDTQLASDFWTIRVVSCAGQ
jgi:C1A family cysteine protease